MDGFPRLSARASWLTLCIAFFAIAFLVYGASLKNEFVNFDDGLLIYNNPISQGLNMQNIKLAFTSYDPELYIPLTFLSYQINYAVGGLHPVVYHVTNILLHTANALLFVWAGFLLTRRRFAAIVAGLIFLIHPLHVEAVAWAAARKDLLASFFFLLSLVYFLRARVCGSTALTVNGTRAAAVDGEGKRAARWYWTSVLFFACALLSKVSTIMLPAVLLLIDWSRGRPMFRKQTVIEMIPYGILAAIFALVAIGGKIGSGSMMLEKILIGCKATAFYLGKIFLPVHLSVLYPYTQPIHLTTPDLLLSVLVVLTITAGCLLALKKSRVPLALWVYFFLLLLPSFGNIAKGQEHFRDIYFASDRYAYLASLSVILLIGLAFDEARKRWKNITQGLLFALVALFALFALFALVVLHQTMTWHDTETLFTHVLSHYPNAQLAHNYVGSYAYERGDVKKALEEYDKSLAIRPNDLGFFNKGVVLEKQGKIGEAMEAYRGAIEINPIAIDARINLGVILLNAEQNAEAARLFQEAIDSAPFFTGVRDLKPLLLLAYFNLGAANEALGKRNEAVAAYAKVLEFDPKDAEVAEKLKALTR